MHSSEPLFHQAILLGGSFLMMKPAEPRTAEFLYSAVTKHLGLADLTPEKRIGGLLTMPQERLVSEVTPEIISLCPMVDGDFIPYVPTFSKLQAGDELSLPGKHWCKRLFSIESQFDVSIARPTAWIRRWLKCFYLGLDFGTSQRKRTGGRHQWSLR